MASYPVTVYRWDDPGAPQIGNGRASDIIDIWQKCLVEGYGTKSPLGWTRPFYDSATQRACFRNNTAAGGSGGYAILYSNTGNNADYNLMRLSHAKSMSDIDTAIGQGFTKAFQVINGIENLRRTKWVLIGTACAFYFLISYDNFQMDGATNSPLPSMFVGDFFSRVPNDAGRFIAECNPQSASSSSSSGQSLNAINALWNRIGVNNKSLRVQSADNTENTKDYTIALQSYAYGETFTVTQESGLPQILTPISICENGLTGTGISPSQTQLNDTASPYYRGQFPGFFIALNPYRNDREFPTIINLGNEDYWLLRTWWGAPCVLINMEVWNDPFL
ncbi:hypothetical protein ORI99_06170 [Alishewanella sp. SMS9]|nr:hypothetical protein [Alishewanella sp. SMS9]